MGLVMVPDFKRILIVNTTDKQRVYCPVVSKHGGFREILGFMTVPKTILKSSPGKRILLARIFVFFQRIANLVAYCIGTWQQLVVAEFGDKFRCSFNVDSWRMSYIHKANSHAREGTVLINSHWSTYRSLHVYPWPLSRFKRPVKDSGLEYSRRRLILCGDSKRMSVCRTRSHLVKLAAHDVQLPLCRMKLSPRSDGYHEREQVHRRSMFSTPFFQSLVNGSALIAGVLLEFLGIALFGEMRRINDLGLAVRSRAHLGYHSVLLCWWTFDWCLRPKRDMIPAAQLLA